MDPTYTVGIPCVFRRVCLHLCACNCGRLHTKWFTRGFFLFPFTPRKAKSVYRPDYNRYQNIQQGEKMNDCSLQVISWYSWEDKEPVAAPEPFATYRDTEWPKHITLCDKPYPSSGTWSMEMHEQNQTSAQRTAVAFWTWNISLFFNGTLKKKIACFFMFYFASEFWFLFCLSVYWSNFWETGSPVSSYTKRLDWGRQCTRESGSILLCIGLATLARSRVRGTRGRLQVDDQREQGEE